MVGIDVGVDVNVGLSVFVATGFSGITVSSGTSMIVWVGGRPFFFEVGRATGSFNPSAPDVFGIWGLFCTSKVTIGLRVCAVAVRSSWLE